MKSFLDTAEIGAIRTAARRLPECSTASTLAA